MTPQVPRPQALVDAALAQAEIVKFGAQLLKAVDSGAPFEDAVRETIEFTVAYVDGNPVLKKMLHDDPETFVALLQQATALALRPYTDRLAARPDQIAEWAVRMIVSMLVAPATTLDGPKQIAELLLSGILKRR